jgi:hypothetical protein
MKDKSNKGDEDIVSLADLSKATGYRENLIGMCRDGPLGIEKRCRDAGIKAEKRTGSRVRAYFKRL